jgi:hypothetical protein
MAPPFSVLKQLRRHILMSFASQKSGTHFLRHCLVAVTQSYAA